MIYFGRKNIRSDVKFNTKFFFFFAHKLFKHVLLTAVAKHFRSFFMYEIDITPISFLLSYNLRQSYAGKGHKPAVSSPEDRRDSKFVINLDRLPDNYRQCCVFWDLVKFPSVILWIGISESLDTLSVPWSLIVRQCAATVGMW